MHHSHLAVSALGLIALLGGCADRAPSADARLAIAVAPLTLDGVTNATYTLSVVNGAGETVWTRTVDADAYGDGAGSLSYVGTCDADSNPNRIDLVVESLEAGGVTLVSGVDWVNPAPPGNPVSRTADCVADQDVAVTFDLSLARAAQQGFFDVALSFSDVFCSAKLDCVRDDGGTLTELHLLSNPSTGDRDRTAVLGFACTAGPNQDTVLHLDPIAIACGSGQSVSVDSSAGPGNLDPSYSGSELLFQAAVYRGVEQLGTNHKAYWNVALGLNPSAAPAPTSCTLTAAGTVTDGPLVGGLTPDGTRWPYVAWSVELYDAAGTYTCGQHGAGDGNGVDLAYSDTAGIAFAASFASVDQSVETYQTACAIPNCASGGLCDSVSGDPLSCDACDAGWTGALCTLAPRLWYRADTLALADGTAVVSWPDAGTANATLVPQGTAPTYRTGVVNGRPVVRFAKAGEMISGAFVLQQTSNDYTFYAVLKAGTTQNQYADILDNNHGGSSNATSAGPVWQQNVSNTNNMGVGFWANPPGVYSGGSPWNVSTAAFTLQEVQKAGTQQTAWVDGSVAISEGVQAIMNKPSVPFALGGNTYIATRRWDGDMAEFIYFNRALTPSERAEVQQILATKYAITLN
ncbi:MAG: hypothetical protein EP329_17435 [Deltaproteobacteria bacterium]|nr:MAG: hypothetical protein EP329_17435 [Deltaproteobacteria bacterium]